MEARGIRLTRRKLLAASALIAGAGILPGRPRAEVPSRLQRLRSAFTGSILVPTDDGYEVARRVASFNPETDLRPAIIARCADDADVARAIEFARHSNAEIAVRCGGHDVLGQSVCAGGVLIDLAGMNHIRIDTDSRLASVGAGLRTAPLNFALQAKGLATPLGCNPLVGIAGLTLGGGLGWLLGKYGAACDNLVSADIVTADGRLLKANREQNPALFWALKGGGGNFGIACTLEYELHPVGDVIGGYLIFEGARLGSLLRFYNEFMASAPDALTAEIAVNPLADGTFISVIVCFDGDEKAAERALAPLRKFGPPVADRVGKVAFAQLAEPPRDLLAQFPGEEVTDLGPRYSYWQGASSSDVGDSAAALLDELVTSGTGGWTFGLGHYLHGAVTKVEADESPLARYKASFSYFFGKSWRGNEDTHACMAWVDDCIEATSRYSRPTYINYLSDGRPEAVAAAYGDSYPRLRQLKRTYDPDNVFHLNRNILPG